MKSILFTTLFYFIMGFPWGWSQTMLLDPSFGVDGKVRTDFDGIHNRAGSIAIQSDGKVIVAGGSMIPNHEDRSVALARYHPNGELDDTFGDVGLVRTEGFALVSIILQNDGKILGASSDKDGSTSDFLVVRYNSDGTLDNTFGSNGITTTDFDGGYDYTRSILVLSSGKILVAGTSYFMNLADSKFAVAKYKPDGSPDTSFGIDGKVTTDVGFGSDFGWDIGIQADGKIVVSGNSLNSPMSTGFSMVRYLADGTLDTSFGEQGIVITDWGLGANETNSMDIQLDGKILLAGIKHITPEDHDFAIARYTVNGELDPTFNGDGRVVTDFGGNEGANSIILLSDNKILVGGGAFDNGVATTIIAKYDSSGKLDHSFNGNGFVASILDTNFSNQAMALDSDGSIFFTGYDSPDGIDVDFCTIKFTPQIESSTIELPLIQQSAVAYPNPFVDQITLNYTLSETVVINILLYDQAGKLIRPIITQQKKNMGNHQQVIHFNKISPAHYYFLTIEDEQKNRMTTKVIRGKVH